MSGQDGGHPHAPGALERPHWEPHTTAALTRAGLRVHVLAAATPSNLTAELARLEDAWLAGNHAAPSFEYEPHADGWHDGLIRALTTMAAALDEKGELGGLYASRARELAIEATLCAQAGKPAFWSTARRRFARRDDFDDAADAMASAWLRESAADAGAPAAPRTLSHDEGSRESLVCRMREELGRRHMTLRVVVKDNLSSLAATGDGVVQVAKGHALTRGDVERTVLHEIEGHVLPRAAASGVPLGIFKVGTAHGSDDQEGRAIALQRAAGFLVGERRRELSLRHVAARSVEERADFVATARLLLEHGAPLRAALRIATRAHRGGGLAREAVYLPALLRVEAATAADPAVDRVLEHGRVAVDAAATLGAWLVEAARQRD